MSTRNLCLRAPVSAADDLAKIVESKHGAWQCQEFADLLEVSGKFVYNEVKRGSLPAYRVGSMLRLDPKTTANWLRARMTVPAAQTEVCHG